MAKLPEPPSAAFLHSIGPAEHVLPAGSILWRIYFRASAHPGQWHGFRYYGPVATARFDHHASPAHVQERGVLYAGTTIPMCVAEVFQRRRIVDRLLHEPWLVGFALTQAVSLLDLCGIWPTRAGASMALASGPRSRAQHWSAAIYDAYPALVGLWYPSSMYRNHPAILLYERASAALPATPAFHEPLSAPGLLAPLTRVAADLGYLLR